MALRQEASLALKSSVNSHFPTSPPKSSHFVPVVLRTFDFVGIAPEKVNTHCVRASFFFERDKFRFGEANSPPNVFLV